MQHGHISLPIGNFHHVNGQQNYQVNQFRHHSQYFPQNYYQNPHQYQSVGFFQ
jgi:hypothetical protein